MSPMEFPPIRDKRPLAVQVYDRLYAAVMDARDTNSPLPTEEELTKQLAVSRTTVRQALALLEEDGVIERGPGRRRHVAGSVESRAGSIVPLEETLHTSGTVTVVRTARHPAPSTLWNSALLGIPQGAPIVTWESEVYVDGVIAASALEFIEADHEPADTTAARTMLAALGPQYQSKASLQFLRIAPYITRTRRIAVTPGHSLVGVSFTASAPGKPSYLAKHVVDVSIAPLDLFATGDDLPDSELM